MKHHTHTADCDAHGCAAARDEKMIADLRRHLERAQGAEADLAFILIRAETAEAELKRINPLYTAACIGQRDAEAALAAERAIPRACRALEQNEVGAPCSYLQDAEAALAAERADNQSAAIEIGEIQRKLDAERIARKEDRQDFESQLEHQANALAAERAAREAAVNSDILTRSMLVAVERHLKFAERERDAWEKRSGQYMDERDAAEDLAREECAKICENRAARRHLEEAHTVGCAWKNDEDKDCAATIRSAITDPEAVKRTMEDAARFEYLLDPDEVNGPWIMFSDGRDTSTPEETRAILDAARKGEEGNRE